MVVQISITVSTERDFINSNTHRVIRRQMVSSRADLDIVGSAEDIPGLFESILDLAGCKECSSSSGLEPWSVNLNTRPRLDRQIEDSIGIP